MTTETLCSTGFGTATSLTNTNSFPNATTYPNGEILISASQPDNRDFNLSTSSASFWGNPEQLEVKEVGETIEMIYKETSNVYRTGGLPPYNDTRIFKIIYSCVDGKWNKSEPIYGKIVEAQEEYYDFDL